MRGFPLSQRMKDKILILDGAMGTLFQQEGLTAEDFGGEQYEGCNEMLNLTRPEIVERFHCQYLKAGADLIETNTFGGTRVVLSEYGLQDKVRQINKAAARIARNAADSYTSSHWPRFVLGSMGPTTKSLSVTGGITFEELAAAYQEQAEGLLEGGVDALLVETAQDTLNVKAAGIGIQRAFQTTGISVPVLISGTIEPMGTTLAGQNIEAFYVSLQHLNPLSIGINCASGPELMADHLRTLNEIAQCAISCYPNAGLPDESGHYHETPEAFARKMRQFAENRWLNIAGGCCGTTPAHIQALAEALAGLSPRRLCEKPRTITSLAGLEPLWLDPENRPYLVGERTNVVGSRKFRELIEREKYEEAAEIARFQVQKGAQIIDVCLANPDRDELGDMAHFLPHVVSRIRVPIMIDSTDPKVIELALRRCQGKSVINSINLEEGEVRFAQTAPLARQYGAAVVVGTIDEQGMALTRDRKLEIARRSYDLLVNRYGLQPQDIIFDPLVFPAATGDTTYRGAALETVEGLKMIKQEFPLSPTILGISNVSFGLPPAGREVLNSVFLYHCTQAGLDLAIVNAEKLRRYPAIPQQERELAEALLFSGDENSIARFTEYFRDRKVEPKLDSQTSLSVEERLVRCVIEGSKAGLTETLDEALKQYKPLEIINGPLMQGMAEVGRLFDQHQLIVAEVLRSAEVMKAAVSQLEPYMDKDESVTRGTILLATVKGDVHDIGKNLVNIILSNNGYRVIDLGTKVPPEEIVAACRQHQPDFIGLSGLLVRSTHQMVVTAQALRSAGIDVPLIVGGAALTEGFVTTRIAPEYAGPVLYARDAMDGLRLVNETIYAQDRASKKNVHNEPLSLSNQQINSESSPSTQPDMKPEGDRMMISQAPVYKPADTNRHILRRYPLTHLEPYLNWQRLLGRHLGVRGNVTRLMERKDPKAIELMETVKALLKEAADSGFIKAHGLYQFFPAASHGNEVLIYDPEGTGKIVERFWFPRQLKAPYLCLADFVRPFGSQAQDYIGLFAVTAGDGVQALARQWEKEGKYLRSHLLQALALELAEAFAERLHEIMRNLWGLPRENHKPWDNGGAIPKYQGIRVSFGYPACPDMAQQEKLFRLLRPEDIGIHLTDSFMMEPEASVSAMVFSHPQARYFSVE